MNSTGTDQQFRDEDSLMDPEDNLKTLRCFHVVKHSQLEGKLLFAFSICIHSIWRLAFCEVCSNMSFSISKRYILSKPGLAPVTSPSIIETNFIALLDPIWSTRIVFIQSDILPGPLLRGEVILLYAKPPVLSIITKNVEGWNQVRAPSLFNSLSLYWSNIYLQLQGPFWYPVIPQILQTCHIYALSCNNRILSHYIKVVGSRNSISAGFPIIM